MSYPSGPLATYVSSNTYLHLAGRLTLAQQLKELHNKAPIGELKSCRLLEGCPLTQSTHHLVEADPETAYSSLGGLKLAEDASIGRGHYAEVG